MLSFRRALQRWPRSVRFFVLALALLQFVAPTWHICEMGGHVMARGAATHHGGSSAVEAAKAASSSDTNKALICFCAPHEKPAASPSAPHLDGISQQDHATCLALLLQTMPGALAAPPAISRLQSLVLASFIARHNEAPQIAILRRFRGRAPPLSV